jgi:putative pyruvate formate lyase activating enzyme
MPGGLAGTAQIMRFIAREVSPQTYVNVMSQYRPCGRAHEVPGLGAALSADEYRRAVRETIAEGITRLDQRQVLFRRW